jgi:hypothetical protein
LERECILEASVKGQRPPTARPSPDEFAAIYRFGLSGGRGLRIVG